MHVVDVPLEIDLVANRVLPEARLPERILTSAINVDSSCPRLSRASTSCLSYKIKDVDGRDKPGHDGGEGCPAMRNAARKAVTLSTSADDARSESVSVKK
jgi:hypothetical protein